jgi:hypothetical protein
MFCIVYCGVVVRILKESESEEKKNTTIWINRCFQALHSIAPTLGSFEDVEGLLLIKFLNKC